MYNISDIKRFIEKRRYMVAERRNARLRHSPTHFVFIIFFDWKESKLTPQSRHIIREAAIKARSLEYISVEVDGHSDTSGQPEVNHELSISRAQVVANELVENGLPANHLEIRGYGDTKLRVPTAAGVREPLNRRVEITIRDRPSTPTRSSGPSRWWRTIPPPPPPPPRTPFDGLYKGTISQSASTQTTGALVGGSCESDRPVSMRVKRGHVRIWHQDHNGHTLHYRGKIEPTGKINAWHTNRDGSRSILAGQINDGGANLDLNRGRCYHTVAMTKTLGGVTPTLGSATPAKVGDEQPSWCFWSTSESVRNEVLSVTAILETALAVTIYWWIALEVGILTPLMVSAAVAPFVLLRSRKSVEHGLRWFGKFGRAIDASVSPGPNRIPLEIALTALLVAIITAGMVGTAALDISKATYLSVVVLGLSALIITGILGVMVSVILLLWMPAPKQSLSLIVSRSAKRNTIFLIPLFGYGLAVFVVVSGIRVVATFAHLRVGLIDLPRNFRRLTFCTSPAHVPELIPGAENTRSGFNFTHQMHYYMHYLKRARTPSEVVSVAFFTLLIIIWFLPPWLYRVTIKSTSWFWWPLAFLGDDLRRAHDPRRFHLKVWGSLWPKASIIMAGLTLIGFIFSNFLLTPGVFERNPLLIPIGYFFFFDWAVDPWQVCALVAGFLSVVIVLGVDDAVGELAIAHTDNNEGLRKVAETKLGWWERVARLRLLFLLAFWLMVGIHATLIVNNQQCWFTLPSIAQAWAIEMYGARLPKPSCIEG